MEKQHCNQNVNDSSQKPQYLHKDCNKNCNKGHTYTALSTYNMESKFEQY